MKFKILGVYETLNLAENARSKKEKIDLLRHQNSEPLKTVVQGAFDERIKWLLPKGKTPYTPANESFELDNALFRKTKTFYVFVEGGMPQGSNMSDNKRQALWVQMLESIHPKDAIILDHMKDKKLPFKTITPALIAEAFPELAIVPVKIKKDDTEPDPFLEDTKTEVIPEPVKAEVNLPAIAPAPAGEEFDYVEDPVVKAQGLAPELVEAETKGKKKVRNDEQKQTKS